MPDLGTDRSELVRDFQNFISPGPAWSWISYFFDPGPVRSGTDWFWSVDPCLRVNFWKPYKAKFLVPLQNFIEESNFFFAIETLSPAGYSLDGIPINTEPRDPRIKTDTVQNRSVDPWMSRLLLTTRQVENQLQKLQLEVTTSYNKL